MKHRAHAHGSRHESTARDCMKRAVYYIEVLQVGPSVVTTHAGNLSPSGEVFSAFCFTKPENREAPLLHLRALIAPL